MIIKNNIVLTLAVTLLCLTCLSFPVHAEEGKNINVCISEDDSIFLDRILRYGLEELGYNVNITSQKMLSCIIGVNEGQFDILGLQAQGLEEQYSNLIMVPETIGDVEFRFYVREKEDKNISGWQDMQGLTVGIEYQRPFVQKRLSGMKGTIVTEYANKEEALQALVNGEIDVAVFPEIFGMQIYLPQGVECGGLLEKQPCYTYLNSKQARLAPALAKKYKEMKSNGKMTELIEKYAGTLDEKQVILHISSYNNDVKADEELNQGIHKALEQYEDTELYYISLNANLRENQETRAKMFGDMLRSDFATRPPDVIVATDSYALDFLKEYYYRLFENVPIILNGVAGMEYAGFGDNVIFIEKKIAAWENVDELLKLFPNTREVYVINDQLKDGRLWEQVMQKELEGRQDVSIRYSGDLSFDELLQEIRSLPGDTVIFSGTYYGGISKKHYSGKEIQKMFEEAYTVPVFSCNLTGFGEGELGGKYIDKEEIGQYIGELAVTLADGKKASEIDIDGERIKNTWFFDYNQLTKWNVRIENLPEESVLINRPLSFGEINPTAYYLGIAAALAGFTAIIVLAWSVYQVRKKNIRLQNLQKNLVEAEQVIEKERIIKMQRDAYRRSQHDLKQIVDSLPWPMCIVGPKDVSIYYGNDAFRDCFRFETESGEEYCIWKIVPEYQSNGETSKDSIRRFIDKVMAAQFSITEEREFIIPNGETVLMRIVGTEIDYDGKPSVSIVLQDISAQKREEILLRSLALKEREANELKSKFIVNMSHEIRTPMNAIIGFSDIQLQKTHNTEIRDTFKKISLSAKLLLALVNDILDYSKIEADRLVITKEEFDLENIIYEAMLTAFERIGKKPVEMLIELEAMVPRKVIGDAVRVWQVIQNILDNSAKYTDTGSVILEVRMEEITAEKQILLFRITDTGKGMCKEELNKIYIPFEQFSGKDIRSSGTGLGMPITRRLVELMDGTIAIESREGAGTTTEIRIPFGISEWSERMIEESAYQIIKGKDILVIDEAPAGVRITTAVLNMVGVRAQGYSHGAEVMKKVQEDGQQGREFDIIVIDQNTEAELFESLRSYPFTKTKLVTLHKPYRPTQFLERLCSLLGGTVQSTKYRNKKYRFPGAKILVCEDNEINQDVITGVLGLYDIKSIVAVNGAEGIKWLEKESFDLVIMDILMPVMDGHQATRAIRTSQKAYSDIPIVAITANAMKSEMAECLEEGMNGYITKPIEMERLYSELLKWLPSSTREEGVDMMAQNIWRDVEEDDRIHAQEVELAEAGIDVGEAVKRFGGKRELYYRSLRKFAADIVNNGMMSSDEAAQLESAELRKYIHSLKGVTANLSMKELNLMIQQMEVSIKEDMPDIELYQRLCTRAGEVSESVLKITESGLKGELEVGNWEACKELLVQLEGFSLLAKAKECEQTVLRLRERQWNNVDTELLEKICSAVEEYDYAKALSILGKLL